jgi:hypothetical protein
VRRLLLACAASILLYALAFGALLGRPLAYGFLERQLDAKLARGAALPSPKLVILAGSNAPYSHRCETIGAMLAMPCVNAGVAVGIGLDYQFARWQPLLQPGDVLYLPMEYEQYGASRAAVRVGPDAAIMLRHDRATLARLPPDRWAGALFSTDFRGALMAVMETALAALGFDPSVRQAVVGGENAWGDHVGHTLALAAPSRAVLAQAQPSAPSVQAITTGYGSRLIGDFARRMAARGVVVVGGLPTGFADRPPPPATLAAVRAVYRANGGLFLTLPGVSLYAREDFFDTAEHLNEPCQVFHSRAIAGALASLLGRDLRPAPILAAAPDACPTEVANPPALAYDPPDIRAAGLQAARGAFAQEGEP